MSTEHQHLVILLVSKGIRAKGAGWGRSGWLQDTDQSPVWRCGPPGSRVQPAEGSECCWREALLHLLHITSQLWPLNGIGNKHKQLASAALLAEHVTANCFVQHEGCGLITGGTFWLRPNSSKTPTEEAARRTRVHHLQFYMIKQLLRLNVVCWHFIVLLLDE